MSKLIPIYKPFGWTPLQAIQRMREKYPEYMSEKISFAGRLDPMAEGVLVVVVGDQSLKEKALHLPKVYEFSFLAGVMTDTFDILGKITAHFPQQKWQEVVQTIEKAARKYSGDLELEYPPFSSKTVHGTPLFQLAKLGHLPPAMPKKMVTIYSLDVVSEKEVSLQEYISPYLLLVQRISGEFRQQEVIQGWQQFIKGHHEYTFPLLKGYLSCSTGTYVRSIVNEIGKEAKVGAMVTHITRTKVGEYSIEDCLRLE